MKKLAVALLVCGAVLVLSLSALAGEKLRLTNGEWAPFMGEKIAENGALSAIVKEAFASQGVDVEFGFFPWKRAILLAEEGEWDGSLGWTKSEERMQKFLYGEPLLDLGEVLFYAKEKPLEWATMGDLKDKRIGVTAGYFYGDDFEKAKKDGVFKADEAAQDEAGFKKLLMGRLDAFICVEYVGLDLMGQIFTPEEREKIGYSPKLVRSAPHYLILSKKSPLGTQEMIDKFNKGLEALKTSGRYQQILDDLKSGKYATK